MGRNGAIVVGFSPRVHAPLPTQVCHPIQLGADKAIVMSAPSMIEMFMQLPASHNANA